MLSSFRCLARITAARIEIVTDFNLSPIAIRVAFHWIVVQNYRCDTEEPRRRLLRR